MKRVQVKQVTPFYVAVVHQEMGHYTGRIVEKEKITGTPQRGGFLDVPDDVFESGVEYGIDFEMVMSELCVSTLDLQNALRGSNIWTYSDFISNPQKVISIVQSLIAAKVGSIQRRIVEVYGGNNE